MKIVTLIILLIAPFMLIGCNSVPTSTNPYSNLSLLVAADDAVVKDATTATISHILPTQDAQQIVNTENLVVLGLPLAVQVAGQTGSPTDPNAVTLAAMDAQVAELAADVSALKSAVTGALAGVVKAAKVSTGLKK